MLNVTKSQSHNVSLSQFLYMPPSASFLRFTPNTLMHNYLQPISQKVMAKGRQTRLNFGRFVIILYLYIGIQSLNHRFNGREPQAQTKKTKAFLDIFT